MVNAPLGPTTLASPKSPLEGTAGETKTIVQNDSDNTILENTPRAGAGDAAALENVSNAQRVMIAANRLNAAQKREKRRLLAVEKASNSSDEERHNIQADVGTSAIRRAQAGLDLTRFGKRSQRSQERPSNIQET